MTKKKKQRKRNTNKNYNELWIHLGNGNPFSQLYRFSPKTFLDALKSKSAQDLPYNMCQKNCVINFFFFTFLFFIPVYFWLINPLKYRFTYEPFPVHLRKYKMLNTENLMHISLKFEEKQKKKNPSYSLASAQKITPELLAANETETAKMFIDVREQTVYTPIYANSAYNLIAACNICAEHEKKLKYMVRLGKMVKASTKWQNQTYECNK